MASDPRTWHQQRNPKYENIMKIIRPGICRKYNIWGPDLAAEPKNVPVSTLATMRQQRSPFKDCGMDRGPAQAAAEAATCKLCWFFEHCLPVCMMVQMTVSKQLRSLQMNSSVPASTNTNDCHFFWLSMVFADCLGLFVFLNDCTWYYNNYYDFPHFYMIWHMQFCPDGLPPHNRSASGLGDNHGSINILLATWHQIRGHGISSAIQKYENIMKIIWPGTCRNQVFEMIHLWWTYDTYYLWLYMIL